MTGISKDGRVMASWDGAYPCYCSGSWTLFVDDEEKTNCIPEDLVNNEMNTYKNYMKWYFKNWMEEWEEYYDGLSEKAWIKENDYWLKNITEDEEVKKDIFEAINIADWRHGCCGGCI